MVPADKMVGFFRFEELQGWKEGFYLSWRERYLLPFAKELSVIPSLASGALIPLFHIVSVESSVVL